MRFWLVFLLVLVPLVAGDVDVSSTVADSTIPVGETSTVAATGASSTNAPSGTSAGTPAGGDTVPTTPGGAQTNVPVGGSTGAATQPASQAPAGPTGSTKSVAANNDLSVTLGARDVLRDALTLSNKIASLTQQINQLSGELDPSTLTNQLTVMAANATAMNTVLTGLQQQIQTLNTTEANLEASYNGVNNYFTCFASSNCVAAPTSPLPTTSPYCNGVAYSTSDPTKSSTYSGQTSSLNCSNIITGGNSSSPMTVNLVITTTVTGNAFLNVLDGQTSTLIKGFTTSVQSQSVVSNKTVVEIAYGVLDGSSSLSFSVQYITVACPLACGNGDCRFDSNGNAFCDCENPCAPPDANGLCTAPETCSRTQQRQCGAERTCVVDVMTDLCYSCKPAVFGLHSVTKYFF